MTRRTPVRRVARPAQRTSPWRIVARSVSLAAGIAAVAVILGLVVIPRLSGGTSLTVLSGSMEPAFSPGDVVVVRGTDGVDLCDEVAIGDVVTYLPHPDDPTLISHRVVAKSLGTFDDGTRCRFVTQGDANPLADDPISPQQIRGLLLWGLPGLGWARQWVSENTSVVVTAGAITLVVWGLWGAIRPPRRRVITVPTRPDAEPASPADEPARPESRTGIPPAARSRRRTRRESRPDRRRRAASRDLAPWEALCDRGQHAPRADSTPPAERNEI